MLMLDTFQEVYKSLMRNKMRSLATGFAVSSGLFLVIVLQGASNGLIHSFEYNLGNLPYDAVNIYGGQTTIPFEGIKDGRYIRLDERDVNMTRRNFSHIVNDVLPVVRRDGAKVSFRGKYCDSSIKGVYPQYSKAQAVRMIKGRFINNVDVSQSRKVVVIDEKTVETLFGKSIMPVGQVINAGGFCYRVIGVYKADSRYRDSEMYAPYSTVSTIYDKGKFVDQITMRLRDMKSVEEMDSFNVDYVRASSKIHSFSPDDVNALWIWNQAQDNMKMQKVTGILNTSFWILGLLTMISGVLGVSNIMLISVKERTREFGIRRAIGARPWSIIRMVMLESVVVTAFFGYVGMFFGIVFCEWMDVVYGNRTMDMGFASTKYFVNPTVDLSTCVTATVIIIIAGALAGFFPARKSVGIKPVDALRA